PCSATSFNTQPNTVSWTSCGSRPRVFDNHEWMRKPTPRLRQPRVIGNLFPVLQPQKIPQRMRIRTPPGDAPLAGDPLEIADHVHAEVPTRRHRRRAHLPCVIRLACPLDKGIETARDQYFLKPVVKHMARRARHLCPGHDQITLPIA